MAAFMSVIRDLDGYERFEKVILVHSVRQVNELAYRPSPELLPQQIPGRRLILKLIYYPP